MRAIDADQGDRAQDHKGVLGKTGQARRRRQRREADLAVQKHQTSSTTTRSSLLIGSTSSAVAVALNHFAQDEKILYLPGISGSNDTTGKDCTRYSFRQCFYGQTAANAIAPVLVKARQEPQGGVHDAGLHLRPHRVTNSVNDYRPRTPAGRR